MSEARRVFEPGAALGEGPVWVEREQALWFVDIPGRRVQRVDSGGVYGAWTAPAPVGWMLPPRTAGSWRGSRRGVHRFDPADGSFAPLADPAPDLPHNRLNDATVDAAGRVWFGLWSGWRARRNAPDGTVAGEVALPVANVTKLAFCGPATSRPRARGSMRPRLPRSRWRATCSRSRRGCRGCRGNWRASAESKRRGR